MGKKRGAGPPPCAYEKKRMKNLLRNAALMKELGFATRKRALTPDEKNFLQRQQKKREIEEKSWEETAEKGAQRETERARSGDSLPPSSTERWRRGNVRVNSGL